MTETKEVSLSCLKRLTPGFCHQKNVRGNSSSGLTLIFKRLVVEALALALIFDWIFGHLHALI